MSNSPASLRSVERAISVLEVLAARGEAGVTEVASEIAVHKSTAFRLLGALEGGGLVEQTGHRGKYRLGFGLIPLAGTGGHTAADPAHRDRGGAAGGAARPRAGGGGRGGRRGGRGGAPTRGGAGGWPGR